MRWCAVIRPATHEVIARRLSAGGIQLEQFLGNRVVEFPGEISARGYVDRLRAEGWL